MPLSAHLEHVNGSSGVQRRLLVDGSHDSALLGLGRVQGGGQIKLQSLGDLVLQLDLSPQQVGGGPCLGKGDAVLEVNVLALDVTGNGGGLGVSGTGDLEGGRVGRSLDFERGTVDGVVLEEQVGGGLAEVLWEQGQLHSTLLEDTARTFHEGGTGWVAAMADIVYE